MLLTLDFDNTHPWLPTLELNKTVDIILLMISLGFSLSAHRVIFYECFDNQQIYQILYFVECARLSGIAKCMADQCCASYISAFTLIL